MSFYSIECRWAGGPGGAGLTTFNVSAEQVGTWSNALVAVENFWTGLMSSFPDDYSVTVPREAFEYDESSGALLGSISDASPEVVLPGTAAGSAYAGGVGVLLGWRTSSIRGRRLVRGRTFLVPQQLGVYDAQGTIVEAHRATVTTAAETLVSDLEAAGFPLVIWSRPTFLPETDPPVVDEPGDQSLVTGVSVPDHVTTLRSRRT